MLRGRISVRLDNVRNTLLRPPLLLILERPDVRLKFCIVTFSNWLLPIGRWL